MANMFNKGLSFFGLADPEDIDDEETQAPEADDIADTEFDRDDSLSMQSARIATAGRTSATTQKSFPKMNMNRITTIHPRTYNEVESVGRSLRDGTPVVLNLTGVADKDAQRIVDFAMGVVFGVRGSAERVTSRVWLLSPAAVTIRPEQAEANPTAGLFE
ncbi:cell division protein SepF [Alloscardovia omnicolens]|uniref:cell division protein SepF n=1 Tax=Alloscardovia omnicolens TaxID=419015 RepID=UPI003A756D43